MSESTPVQRKSLFAAGLAHICQDGLEASTYVLLPILASTFGLSYGQVGAIKGVKSLALGLLELVSGFVTERFGESRVLISGLLIAGTGYAAVAMVDTIQLVVCCLILLGIGGGLQHAPASTLVSRTFDYHNRRGALGLYNSSGDIGKLLFTALFSFATGVGLAWQHIIFTYAGVALLAALLIAISISTQHPSRTIQPSITHHEDKPQGLHGWGVLNVHHFTLLLVIVFLDNVVQVGVLLFVAFLMLSNELPVVVATLAITLVLVGGVIGKARCGYLAEQMGVRRAFVLVQLLTAAGLIGLVVAPGWLALILLIPLGAVSQGSTSITYGLLPDYIHPERLARGYSILYSSTSIAAATGAWLVGLSADWFGIERAFLIMALVSLLALAPVLFNATFAAGKTLEQ